MISRSKKKEHCRTFVALTRRRGFRSKAGFARSQCCLRQEAFSGQPSTVHRPPNRNSGEDCSGMQGLLRGEAFVGFNVVFSSDQWVQVLKRATDLQEPVPLRGASLSFKLRPVTAGSGEKNWRRSPSSLIMNPSFEKIGSKKALRRTLLGNLKVLQRSLASRFSFAVTNRRAAS